MKLKDIHGKEIAMLPKVKSFSEGSRSKLQLLTRDTLIAKYPHEIIYEDFTIPGSRLSVDFLLYRVGLVIEVDGKQHSEFSAFHHGDRTVSHKLANQRKNDRMKTQWCE